MQDAANSLSRVLLQHALFEALGEDGSRGDEAVSSGEDVGGTMMAQVRSHAGRMPPTQRRMLRLKLARAFLTELDRGITTHELVATDSESWGG